MTDVDFRQGVYPDSGPQTTNLVGSQSVQMGRDPPQDFARLAHRPVRRGRDCGLPEQTDVPADDTEIGSKTLVADFTEDLAGRRCDSPQRTACRRTA